MVLFPEGDYKSLEDFSPSRTAFGEERLMVSGGALPRREIPFGSDALEALPIEVLKSFLSL